VPAPAAAAAQPAPVPSGATPAFRFGQHDSAKPASAAFQFGGATPASTAFQFGGFGAKDTAPAVTNTVPPASMAAFQREGTPPRADGAPPPALPRTAPAPEAEGAPNDGGGAVPEAYDAQVECLVSFYAAHDSGKGESDCKAMLDKRLAGGTGGLSTLKFSQLCSALQKEYGANPLDGAKPTAAAGALLSSSSHLIFSNFAGGLYGMRYGSWEGRIQ
jgi:hypothetical protein